MEGTEGSLEELNPLIAQISADETHFREGLRNLRIEFANFATTPFQNL